MPPMRTRDSRNGDTYRSGIQAGARRLALTGRVMTLSTFSGGKAWAAPVYYLFSAGAFYFFSNRESRHIRDLEESRGVCAAAVFHDDQQVENIKGLQMQGSISQVERKVESSLKALAYVKKFRIDCDTSRITEFFHKAYNASLYRFVPDAVFYMDNSIEFGFRQSVSL